MHTISPLRCVIPVLLVRSAALSEVAGTHDLSFLNNIEGPVYSVAMQPDGQTVAGGYFYTLGDTEPSSIARLNPDGTLEDAATFDPGSGSQYAVFSVVVQDDGRILVGGAFNKIDGQFRTRIARLLPNGSLESTATFDTGAGPDGNVRCMALQPDGKILIGGEFRNVNHLPRRGIARLTANGSVENTPFFNSSAVLGGLIRTIALQPDGKILIGGDGITLQGRVGFHTIARLHPNGTLESASTFDATTLGTGRGYFLRLQADGKILVSGEINGLIRRLNADGTVDTTFQPNPGIGIRPFAIQLQTNGQMLLGGDQFHPPGVTTDGCLARVNPDGSLAADGEFEHTAGLIPLEGTMFALAPHPNGRFVTGGDFTVNVPDAPMDRRYISRFFNDPAVESLVAESRERVLWLRSGTSAEVSSVVFQWSTDGGSSWSAPGHGSRIGGGWELTGAALPASGHLRARGRIGGSLLETVAPFSFLLTALETWRMRHFGTAANTGMAADTADSDNDGLSNLMEFAFALNPTLPDAATLPEWQRTPERYTLEFPRPATGTDITYTAEKSASLQSEWTTIPNTGTEAVLSFTAPAAGAVMFLRLKVTSPQ